MIEVAFGISLAANIVMISQIRFLVKQQPKHDRKGRFIKRG